MHWKWTRWQCKYYIVYWAILIVLSWKEESVLLKESEIVGLVKCTCLFSKKLIKYLPLGNTPLNERVALSHWKSKNQNHIFLYINKTPKTLPILCFNCVK